MQNFSCMQLLGAYYSNNSNIIFISAPFFSSFALFISTIFYQTHLTWMLLNMIFHFFTRLCISNICISILISVLSALNFLKHLEGKLKRTHKTQHSFLFITIIFIIIFLLSYLTLEERLFLYLIYLSFISSALALLVSEQKIVLRYNKNFSFKWCLCCEIYFTIGISYYSFHRYKCYFGIELKYVKICIWNRVIHFFCFSCIDPFFFFDFIRRSFCSFQLFFSSAIFKNQTNTVHIVLLLWASNNNWW